MVLAYNDTNRNNEMMMVMMMIAIYCSKITLMCQALCYKCTLYYLFFYICLIRKVFNAYFMDMKMEAEEVI